MEASDHTPDEPVTNEPVTETDDERRARELDEREQALADRERDLEDARHRAEQAEAAKAAGLDHEPAVPRLDHAPASAEDVQELAGLLAEYRKELQAVRAELKKRKVPVPTGAGVTETPEQRRNARIELIAQHSHYCPECGNLGKYPQKCTGLTPGDHPAREMVGTDELNGDPANHTAARSADPDFPDEVAA